MDEIKTTRKLGAQERLILQRLTREDGYVNFTGSGLFKTLERMQQMGFVEPHPIRRGWYQITGYGCDALEAGRRPISPGKTQ